MSHLAPRLRDSELILVGGETREEVAQRAKEWAAWAGGLDAATPLADAAWTVTSSWKPGNLTLGMVVTDLADLNKKLGYAAGKLAEPEREKLQSKNGIFFYADPMGRNGRTAFVFPGEGAQYPEMLKDLCIHFPVVRDAFDLVDEACLMAGDGFAPSRSIFPVEGDEEARNKAMFAMEIAVESVSAANMALSGLLTSLSVHPAAVVGHSSGEFAALDYARAVNLDDRKRRLAFIRDGYLGIKKLTARTDIPEGILVTVGGVTRDVIDEQLGKHGDKLLLAMDNCPHQYVVCARPEIVDELMKAFGSRGAIAGKLEFNRPYHTPWFEPALDGLRDLFRTYGVRKPSVETWSCLSAGPIPAEPRAIEDLCVGQWAAEVRFTETIRNMYEAGCRVFIEVGPRGNLTSFVNDILKDEDAVAIPLNRIHKSGMFQLHFALAMMAAHGVLMDVAPLFEPRGCRNLREASPAPAKKGITHWFPPYTPKLDAAGLPVPKPSPSAAAPAVNRTEPPAPATAHGRPALPDEAARRVMHAYFDTMEQFLAMQDDMIRQVVGSNGSNGGGAVSAAVAPAPARLQPETGLDRFPMLGTWVDHQPGTSGVIECRYNLDEQFFLRDHALGRGQVSISDPALYAYCIMPLTMSLTALSEAARALFPDKVVIGLKDIRANKWLSFEQHARTVRIKTRVVSSGPVTEVHAELRDDDPNDPRAGFKPCLNEAVILLADAYPAAPEVPAFDLKGEKPCHWTGSEIYPDRLFHGPMFQGITSINGWWENGVTGTVETLDRRRLITSNPSPVFGIDGILLDTVGGVLGLWGAYDRYDGYVFLPFRISGVQFYQGQLDPGTAFDLVMHVIKRDSVSAVADIYAYDKAGKVAVGIQGWEDRDFYVTPSLHRITHEPMRYTFSDRVEQPGIPGTVCATPELPPKFFESGHRVWDHVLTMIMLDAEERAARRGLSGTEDDKAKWILTRTAAKDAVRLYVGERYELQIGSADIHIDEADGRFTVSGTWLSAIPEIPDVHVAWKNGRALAAAVPQGTGNVSFDLSVL